MRRITLDNGLRIISLKKPKDYTGRLIVGINYGQIYEEKTNGLAHFLEHMIISADTKYHTSKQIGEKIDFCGGIVNAHTYHERLIYEGSSPSKSFEDIIDLLLELVFRTSFKTKCFKKEKKVILNEILKDHDDPYHHIDKIFLNTLYKNHPIRFSILGTINSLEKLTLKQIIEAHKKYFVPNNVVIGIFGNFDNSSFSKVKNVLNKFKMRTIQKPRILKENKRPFKKSTIRIRKDLMQSYIQTGVKTEPATHKDTHILDIISTLLGFGSSSRLYREIRLRKALAYHVSAGHIKERTYGYFLTYAETKKQNLNKILRLIKKEFKKLREKKITPNELKRTKNMVIAENLFSFERPISGSIRFVNDEMILGNVNKIKSYMKKVDSVTAKDILEVANKYFDEEKFATAIIRPR
ncbi:MAG: hypothetical protein GTN36_01985 [Candidatus Aenigmarchaeota archaeon]|nr:hypothetical protein [Candidatus Aenigmarchaeota archaeon]